MKAIITRPREDGTYDDVGMNNRILTGDYVTTRNLIKHGTPKHFKGKLRYEIFHGSILKEKPDSVFYKEVNYVRT